MAPSTGASRVAVARVATEGLASARLGPRVLVAAAVVWNLVTLRAETFPVAYYRDSPLQEQMVRFATAQLRGGHLPLVSWFPLEGLGSSLFVHYQSLPAMLAGALGLVTGPDVAFRWTLYLLLAFWPVSVYVGARLFGAGRVGAAASAAMAPFLASAVGIGYETRAYVWDGLGLWTQLWAMFTLPIAWGLCWRAIREGRGIAGAVAVTALTVWLHFLTGYLALLPLLFWPFVAGPRTELLLGVRRAALLLVGVLLACAWVIVPLLAQRKWTAVNERELGSLHANGYGVGRVLHWLVTGQLLDHGRLPVITVLAAVGLVVAVLRARRDADQRALLVALMICLILSFGRTTFGSLADVIPGAQDIFFRRFMMGIQLVALLLAGHGAAWAWVAARRLITVAGPRVQGLGPRGPGKRVRVGPGWAAVIANRQRLALAAGLMAAVVVLAPAWLQLRSHDRRTAAAIDRQEHADATDGADVDRLLKVVRRDGGGRVYSGLDSFLGLYGEFTVGKVPVDQYLAGRDIDVVGDLLTTTSLMMNPEVRFSDSDLSDYQLFGIHYLLLPKNSGDALVLPTKQLATAGPYGLWALSTHGYIHTGAIVGQMSANRANLGTKSVQLLHGDLAANHRYVRVDFDRHQPTTRLPARMAAHTAAAIAGRVNTEADHLTAGRFEATITLHHPGVAVLSESYDPGWRATIDGHSEPTEMIAPALVGVHVPAGTHKVEFEFHGYDGYPTLLALAVVTLIVFACWKPFRTALNRRVSR